MYVYVVFMYITHWNYEDQQYSEDWMTSNQFLVDQDQPILMKNNYT